jgi:subtilisin family serine protease
VQVVACFWAQAAFTGYAQTDSLDTWRVSLVDKPEVRQWLSAADPCRVFSEYAVERRLRHGLVLLDPTDAPVDPTYIREISGRVHAVVGLSKWLNTVWVHASAQQAAQVAQLSFVATIDRLAGSQAVCAETADHTDETPRDALLLEQTASLQAESFWRRGLRGKGVRIAVLDAGFPNLATAPEFAHCSIAAQYDFVRKRADVNHGHPHGTMVSSCIVGRTTQNLPIGLAPEATLLLARTERFWGEPIAEEYNWAAAAEWADSLGADIINSSLGYTKVRYKYEQMNGTSTVVSRAAALAARKGIVVVNAMGNEGSGSWKYVAAPADADPIVAVGAIAPRCGYVPCGFSSLGPTADGRIKPDVCAFGQAVVRGSNGLNTAFGTSFSAPLITGFIACMVQYRPGWAPIQIRDTLRSLSTLWPFYDYAWGFGIPQAERLFQPTDGQLKPLAAPPFLSVAFDSLQTCFRVRFEAASQSVIGAVGKRPPLLHYHTRKEDGRLTHYGTFDVESAQPFALPAFSLPSHETLCILFEGQYYELTPGQPLRIYTLPPTPSFKP